MTLTRLTWITYPTLSYSTLGKSLLWIWVSSAINLTVFSRELVIYAKHRFGTGSRSVNGSSGFSYAHLAAILGDFLPPNGPSHQCYNGLMWWLVKIPVLHLISDLFAPIRPMSGSSPSHRVDFHFKIILKLQKFFVRLKSNLPFRISAHKKQTYSLFHVEDSHSHKIIDYSVLKSHGELIPSWVNGGNWGPLRASSFLHPNPWYCHLLAALIWSSY